MICCWSTKGGSGTSVVACGLAVLASRQSSGALLVDLAGDQAGLLGIGDQRRPGVADWLDGHRLAPPDALGRLEVEITAGLRLLPTGANRLGSPAAGPHERAELLAGVLAADHRAVVVDGGVLDSGSHPVVQALATAATRSLLVVRPCYLALRRAVSCGMRPTAVVVVREPGRALTAADVESVVGAPVVAEVAVDAAVARAADAGLLASRLPGALGRPLGRLR
jgi:MinD-like ATPase involved in chromosome partitioning or flagellar assembly